MIRVLVVDDNPVVRGGLRSLLETAGDIEVAGEAGTGQEALEQAEVLTPDVVLLDVQMPVMDGVTAAARISRQVPVLMLTYAEEPDTICAAIRAGASGYLVHGRFEPDELVEAVYTVHDGGSVVSEAATPAVFEALRESPSRTPAEELGLSEREEEIMQLVVRGHSNREIADELVIAYKTVKNHLNRIYTKLGVDTRSEAIARWFGTDERRRGRTDEQ